MFTLLCGVATVFKLSPFPVWSSVTPVGKTSQICGIERAKECQIALIQNSGIAMQEIAQIGLIIKEIVSERIFQTFESFRLYHFDRQSFLLSL